jgi:SAM-dependent methyltransferase
MHAGCDPARRASPAGPAFGAIAETYDALFSNSLIGRRQRGLVWREAERAFRPGQRVLEINCGTGIDALRLSGLGLKVVACDSAPEMIAAARQRLGASVHAPDIDLRCVPTEAIGQLEAGEPYDGVFSNFSGLNCLADLRPVARDLARLVRPGGKAVFCLFGKFCAWEVVWHLSGGEWRKAFRRLGDRSIPATISGSTVNVRYPSVRSLERSFRPHFRLERWVGVGVALPPSYVEPLAVRFPALVRLAAAADPWLGGCPGFRSLADHMTLTFRRI